MNNLICETVQKSSFYTLPKQLTTSIFKSCVTVYHKLFISDLAYTNHTKTILRSSLNYKKLLKCGNVINFLRTNLNPKKPKNVLIPSPSIFPT